MNQLSKEKVLVVIDMQNDFITGALANEEGQKIVGALKERIETCKKEGFSIFFTRDTHGTNYLETQEGRKLPVPHCLKGTDGWQIVPELQPYAEESRVFDKPSFSSPEIPVWIKSQIGTEPETIELCGVCTDICVISNAMVLKAAFPETPITVKADLCAGVTVESHRNALSAMGMCQINVE